MFSERTSWDLSESEFSAAIRDARASGRMRADLTVSNPTQCGFAYAPGLLTPLAEPAAMAYEPEPFGMLAARQAVCAYYRDQEATVTPASVCLTTSTSEAYSFLFRTLCDPGDEVLVARPSYPLFDFIARLDGVVLREYPLLRDPFAGGAAQPWTIDFRTLAARISPRTRAIIVVHPNNPTGHFVSAAERAALEQLCVERGLALIVDEVFLDYAVTPDPPRSFAAGPHPVLTFVLSGLSKVCALPQMKASWTVACGPASLVDAALARLEMVADTFLSMNAPVQHALGSWLAQRNSIQRQILERVSGNLHALDAALDGTAAERLAIEGGWTAVLRVPAAVDDHSFAEAALARGVLVQPGAFYGMGPGWAVVSLLTPPDVWAEGLALLPIH